MNTFQFQRRAVALASMLLIANAQALAQEPVLESVVVTGTADKPDSITKPFSVITADELNASGASTIGEALRYQPGVSSTGFGPNSSRPIVRGQDSDRIKILRNSAATVDVSALSFDHALPVDPFALHQIEILRGPAALAYGGNAVGGVVNVIDNRIPSEAVSGVQGKAQLQVGTGNDERSVAGLVEAGNERYALHLDGFDRRTGDVRVPVSLDCTKPGSPANIRRICNSASQSSGGAVGASTFWDHGYLGASVNTYQSDYGTVAEDEVTIGMKTTRYALEGQVRQLPGWLESVKARLGHRYCR